MSLLCKFAKMMLIHEKLFIAYTAHRHKLRFLKNSEFRRQTEMIPYHPQISAYGKRSLKFSSSVYSGAEYNRR